METPEAKRNEVIRVIEEVKRKFLPVGATKVSIEVTPLLLETESRTWASWNISVSYETTGGE